MPDPPAPPGRLPPLSSVLLLRPPTHSWIYCMMPRTQVSQKPSFLCLSVIPASESIKIDLLFFNNTNLAHKRGRIVFFHLPGLHPLSASLTVHYILFPGQCMRFPPSRIRCDPSRPVPIPPASPVSCPIAYHKAHHVKEQLSPPRCSFSLLMVSDIFFLLSTFSRYLRPYLDRNEFDSPLWVCVRRSPTLNPLHICLSSLPGS